MQRIEGYSIFGCLARNTDSSGGKIFKILSEANRPVDSLNDGDPAAPVGGHITIETVVASSNLRGVGLTWSRYILASPKQGNQREV